MLTDAMWSHVSVPATGFFTAVALQARYWMTVAYTLHVHPSESGSALFSMPSITV